MFMLPGLIQSLVQAFESQRQRDQLFLSRSLDGGDLERRLHRIEERDRSRAAGVVAGLYPR